MTHISQFILCEFDPHLMYMLNSNVLHAVVSCCFVFNNQFSSNLMLVSAQDERNNLDRLLNPNSRTKKQNQIALLTCFGRKLDIEYDFSIVYTLSGFSVGH